MKQNKTCERCYTETAKAKRIEGIILCRECLSSVNNGYVIDGIEAVKFWFEKGSPVFEHSLSREFQI